MSDHNDLSGEGFVDGMPDFLEALSEDATEDVTTELAKEIIDLQHVTTNAMHFITCYRLPRSYHRPKDRSAFRPISWPRYT